MTTRSSSWTGRAPRTCEEAFGPYCGMHSAQRKRSSSVGMYVAAAVVLVATLILWGVK